MDVSYETSLLAKAVWSAVVVLGLAFVAERVSTRIAGLLSGAPLNAVLVYYFVASDLGPAYILESIPHGIASFTATLAFVLSYYLTSTRMGRFAVSGSAIAGVAAYVGVATVLVAISLTLVSAAILTLTAITLAIWLFRRIEFVPVENPVRYTTALLVARGGFAVVLIVGVITLAEALGTRWTGLLTGFPATLLPTLVIIHSTYGTASTHAVIRNFPLGVGSIILYMLSVPITFPLWGIFGGTFASLAISFAYLSAVMLWGHHRATRRARSTES
jgi:uncharacterized membrane protein (GlpM family)